MIGTITDPATFLLANPSPQDWLSITTFQTELIRAIEYRKQDSNKIFTDLLVKIKKLIET